MMAETLDFKLKTTCHIPGRHNSAVCLHIGIGEDLNRYRIFLEYPAHLFSDIYKSKIAVRGLFESKLAGLGN